MVHLKKSRSAPRLREFEPKARPLLQSNVDLLCRCCSNTVVLKIAGENKAALVYVPHNNCMMSQPDENNDLLWIQTNTVDTQVTFSILYTPLACLWHAILPPLWHCQRGFQSLQAKRYLEWQIVASSVLTSTVTISIPALHNASTLWGRSLIQLYHAKNMAYVNGKKKDEECKNHRTVQKARGSKHTYLARR